MLSAIRKPLLALTEPEQSPTTKQVNMANEGLYQS